MITFCLVRCVALETIICAAVKDSWLTFTTSRLKPSIRAFVRKRSLFGMDSFCLFKFKSSVKLIFCLKVSFRIGSTIFCKAIKNSSGDSIWSFTNGDRVSENRTTDFLLIILVHKFGNACKIFSVKKRTTLWPLFMDGVHLPQGYNNFEEAVYFLPFSFQKCLVLILSTSEGWKAESTLEPPSGFQHGTPGLGIHRPIPLGHWILWC